MRLLNSNPYYNNYGTVPQSGTAPVGYYGYNTQPVYTANTQQQNYVYNQPYGYNNNSMGGYYNNQYDPFYYIRQREEEEARQKAYQEQLEQEQQIYSIMNRVYETYTGQKVEVPVYDPQEEFEKQQKTQKYVNELCANTALAEGVRTRTAIGKKYVSPRYKIFSDHIDKALENPAIKEQKECKSLYEFFEHSGHVLMQIKEEQVKFNDLSKAYMRPEYRQIVDMHKATKISSFDSLSPDFSIDDMEITLPDRIKNDTTYREARSRFLNNIMNPLRLRP